MGRGVGVCVGVGRLDREEYMTKAKGEGRLRAVRPLASSA